MPLNEAERGWLCHLCSKLNEQNSNDKCSCCGRPRDYALRSLTNCAKPLALNLHADLSTITRPEQVHDMVKRGINVNEKSMDGFTALHCAALHGQSGVVRALLKAHADAEIPADDDRRALHFAVESGDLKTVQELLSWRANPNITTKCDNLTPLHIACTKGFANITDLLLRSGADAFLTSKRMRQTPLHFAAELGHVKCIDALLQHANSSLLNCVDVSGATAIQLAQFAQQLPVYELLYLHQGDSVLHDRTLDYLLGASACKPVI